jgi:hypothetical protein
MYLISWDPYVHLYNMDEEIFSLRTTASVTDSLTGQFSKCLYKHPPGETSSVECYIRLGRLFVRNENFIDFFYVL